MSDLKKKVGSMIYIIFGPPRTGKTYWTTRKAIRLLKAAGNARKKGKPFRKVFSNYPIITPYGSALKWLPEYVREEITDSDIFIDEAYMYYNSRNFKNFTSDEHSFFALNGHNSNNIYLIAHSPSRLDTVIREMVNVFYYVKKVAIPFADFPLWFRVEGYLDELALSQRYTTSGSVYSVDHYLFSKSVANCYNTQYFRKGGESIIFPSWAEDPEFDSGKFVSQKETASFLSSVEGKILVFLHRVSLVLMKIYCRLSPFLQAFWCRISPFIEKVPIINKILGKFVSMPKNDIILFFGKICLFLACSLIFACFIR